MYWKVSPPGDPTSINVEHFDLDDSIPEDAAIREVVAGLRNGKAGGSGGVRAEHIKTWLRSMIEEEEKGTENAGEMCQLFVRLIQTIWDKGEILR